MAARYRGSFFYDIAKSSVVRLALAQAEELRSKGVAAVALTPGFLRSEAVLDHFGVSKANWRDAIAKNPHFEYSETPHYVGRAVVALALDPNILARSGDSFTSWELVFTASRISTEPNPTGAHTRKPPSVGTTTRDVMCVAAGARSDK